MTMTNCILFVLIAVFVPIVFGYFDFGRILFIRDFEQELLKSAEHVEKLVLSCGINNENFDEFPSSLKEYCGGMFIYQYPHQFSKYITLLGEFPIVSYLEIGCRWGGTFVFTVEYLSRFRKMEKAVAVDLIESNVIDYKRYNPIVDFFQLNSGSVEFREYMSSNKFDVIFIDGDHSYEGVRNDYLLAKDHAHILVFHDIFSASCEDVNRFWNEEFRAHDGNGYYFFEFLEQYELTSTWHGATLLGIGVVVKAEYLNELNKQSGGQYEHVINRAVNGHLRSLRSIEL